MSRVTGATLPHDTPSLGFELGGPAWRLMQRIGLIRGNDPAIGRRVVAVIAITWIPLLVLTAWQGNAIGPTPRTSFLLDFATYARLFVALPLIFLAEAVVGPRLRAAGMRFYTGELLATESRPAFLAIVARVERLREAALPEIVFLLLALMLPWFLTLEGATLGEAPATWAH